MRTDDFSPTTNSIYLYLPVTTLPSAVLTNGLFNTYEKEGKATPSNM